MDNHYAQALFKHPEACHRPVPAAHVKRPTVAYVIRRKNSLTSKDFVGIFFEQNPEVIGRHWHDQVLFTMEGRDYEDARRKAFRESQNRGLHVNDN